MTQLEIFEEVRSVFRTPMNGDDYFRFKVLQSSGGDSRNLVIPELSSTYRWTAAAFAGKNAKTPIYILALKVSFLLGYNACTVSFHSYSAVGNMALFSVQEPALPRFFVHNT